MSALRIEPTELKFPCEFLVASSPLVCFSVWFLVIVLFLVLDSILVEVKKQISCSLQLSNKIDDYVAFKVKTTSPKKYCVRPNSGIVPPQSTFDVIVTMQAQREAPPDMQCKDKFLVQSVVVSAGATAKDITLEMFTKDSGNVVDEVKLRVVYISPPQPPSPVSEGSEEGSSPRQSSSDNGDLSNKESSFTTKAHVKQGENSRQPSALIAGLTEEKNSTSQESNKLRKESDLIQQVNKQRGAFTIMFVVIVALLGILVSYLVRT
ncbi:vesicle-associated protein 1-2-like isoform X2 [Typha angustifolia]|uniref:vesicle-associated protein 1-2-like isoform X2 n=1 Tax=Typha angustifolia TaxID=59011 RepID=UPI003C2D8627